MKDDLYQSLAPGEGSFRFDRSVVEVFEDMIRRSVPGYGLTLEMIGVVARRAMRETVPTADAAPALAYDLGCSLGASMFPILAQTDAQVVGVDLSADMLAQAAERLAPVYAGRYTLQQADLASYRFAQPAQLIVSNFTLQFLPLEQRLGLLRRAYEALLPGGILLISEKFRFPNTPEQELLTDLHHTFKASQGYSAMEIARKRDAIDQVLVPESVATHLDRLRSLGFAHPVCWYQCFTFGSFLAVKGDE